MLVPEQLQAITDLLFKEMDSLWLEWCSSPSPNSHSQFKPGQSILSNSLEQLLQVEVNTPTRPIKVSPGRFLPVIEGILSHPWGIQCCDISLGLWANHDAHPMKELRLEIGTVRHCLSPEAPLHLNLQELLLIKLGWVQFLSLTDQSALRCSFFPIKVKWNYISKLPHRAYLIPSLWEETLLENLTQFRQTFC